VLSCSVIKTSTDEQLLRFSHDDVNLTKCVSWLQCWLAGENLCAWCCREDNGASMRTRVVTKVGSKCVVWSGERWTLRLVGWQIRSERGFIVDTTNSHERLACNAEITAIIYGCFLLMYFFGLKVVKCSSLPVVLSPQIWLLSHLFGYCSNYLVFAATIWLL
jgi:hypothetical protein